MTGNLRKARLASALLAGSLAAGALLAGTAFAGSPADAADTGGRGAMPDAQRSSYAAAVTAAETEASAMTHIVAVGDSITVGYEFGLTDRSNVYGYVDRVYEQALYHGRADVQNFGVLGLKTSGLKRWLEAAENGTPISGEEAQPGISSKYPLAAETIARSAELRKALEQADIVVMTIGGNDFLPLFDEIKAQQVSPDELKAEIAAILEAYKTSLEASVHAMLAINPKAEIVFSDQYLPVPDPSKNRLVKIVTADQYAVLLDGMKSLRQLVESVGADFKAQDANVMTVDVSEAFLGHEMTYISIAKGDIHPNDDGYAAIAEAFADGIWGEYREPAPLADGVPLRIVVNGRTLAGGNKPVLTAGTTYLPMREVANALGASLAWDGATKTATFTTGRQTVAFTIGAKTMKVGGQSVPLATPAYLDKKASATYLPLAALSKGLGYQVDWRSHIKTAFINS